VTLKLTRAEHAAIRAAVRKLGPPTTVSSWFRDHGLAPLGLGGLAKKRARGERHAQPGRPDRAPSRQNR